jgi:hypothetical protein
VSIIVIDHVEFANTNACPGAWEPGASAEMDADMAEGQDEAVGMQLDQGFLDVLDAVFMQLDHEAPDEEVALEEEEAQEVALEEEARSYRQIVHELTRGPEGVRPQSPYLPACPCLPLRLVI